MASTICVHFIIPDNSRPVYDGNRNLSRNGILLYYPIIRYWSNRILQHIVNISLFQNWLSDLEIFATLVAAIIHDFEHTGTTNNFHVMSGSDTALLYNDRAVLENHHISAAFRYVNILNYNLLPKLCTCYLNIKRVFIKNNNNGNYI